MEEPAVIGDWKKVCILGSGGFGVVTLWRNDVKNDNIAVKKCRWHMPEHIPPRQCQRWTHEVDIMRKIHHENIVSYKQLPDALDSELSKFNLSKLPLLPMEYCTKGNLRRHLGLHQNACGLPEIEVRYVLRDLLNGISYLHELKITHRDIKPENIVLQQSDMRPNKTIYKLIDLGYAKELNSNVASFVGTLQYLAPEIFLNENYSCNVDYWSFGIVAFEIICGVHPFLPNLQPIERFDFIRKKSPEHICIYTSRSGEIKYENEIVNENHISSVLKNYLAKWLSVMLRYDPLQRGVTGTDKNVFDELQDILNKNIICLFSVYNYNYYYYEVDDNTLLKTLQEWIEKDTMISVNEQLLITDNMYYDVDEDRKVLQCFDEMNINTMLVLFKRGEFVSSSDVELPMTVKNLLKNVTKEYKWNTLFSQIAHSVHFILRETKFIRSFKKAFLIESDYLQNLFRKESATFASLRAAAGKLLIEIEYCKNVNVEMRDVWSDDSNAERVRKYRRHLRQTRELIENVNSVGARHVKLQEKEAIVRVSSDTIQETLGQLNPDQLYNDAVSCMIINKQKAILTSNDIIKVISRCIKSRYTIINDDFIKQHLLVTSKILREINRLFKWMKALDLQMQKLSLEMRSNHVEMFKNYSANRGKGSQSVCSNSSDVDIECLSIDDLDSNNKQLRYSTQEVLNQLLLSYKDFTIDMELCNTTS